MLYKSIICLHADKHNPIQIAFPLKLSSRNLLADWVLPYPLLAERGTRFQWWSLLTELRTFFEHNTQAWQESNQD
jgi:hypothetical protein